MTNIYLVRHCESYGNTVRIFQGHYDTDITEMGQVQLDALSERFKNKKLDAVISSPLKRTRKTAEAINKYHGLPIIIDEGFIEINGGKLEGMGWEEIRDNYPEQAYNWVREIYNFQGDGGDKASDVAKRGFDAIRRIAKEYKGKNVAIATHGGLIRFSMSLISGGKIEDMVKICWPNNTAITHLQFDDDLNCTIKFYNDNAHLDGIDFVEVWSQIDAECKYPLSDKWSNREK